MKKVMMMVALMLAVGVAVSGCASHKEYEGHPASHSTDGGHSGGCH